MGREHGGLALIFVVLASLVVHPACSGGEAHGGFEDSNESGTPLPPDLPHSECDPRRENDCEVGDKCSFVIDPEFGPLDRCVPILGEGLAGEPCEQIGESDSCANHHLCWSLDGEGQGICVEFCSTALKCDDPLATCSVSNGALLSLCLPKCDPLLQDCEQGFGCYPDDVGRWACDRDQSGALGQHGEACECLNCCDPGLVCLPGALIDAEGCGAMGAAGCCAQLCTLPEQPPTESLCPTENEDCDPYYDAGELVMGYDQVGVCRL